MTETIHFLGGSPLNRVSWLRPSSAFLNMALETPETRWAVFQAGKPLVSRGTSSSSSLALLPTAQLRHVLGEMPVFAPATSEGARLTGPPVVFLGVREPEGVQALPSSEYRTPKTAEEISGAPYFGLDVGNVPQDVLDTFMRGEEQVQFDEPRSASAAFSMFDAAVFAEARSMLDWQSRNKFCPACGSRTYSLWGGWKLACTSLLPWAQSDSREPCPSGSGLHNFAHPRTDAVVITAVIDETGDRILLGRNRKFPNGFFSTLAGLIEPAESFEDAVKREIWEESGVRVHDVKYHSSQPWPYPANLMVGCYAFADSSQTIRTDLDNELSEARWFTRGEVKAALAHPQGTVIRRAEYKQLEDNATEERPPDKTSDGDSPPFRVPPRTAIAGVLISDWATGKYPGTIKGNL